MQDIVATDAGVAEPMACEQVRAVLRATGEIQAQLLLHLV
jgi:hypothetical protein